VDGWGHRGCRRDDDGLIDDADGTRTTTLEEATRRDGDARWGGDANAFARGV
jgi:hypothetical protein